MISLCLKKEKNNFGFGQTQKSILFSKVVFDPIDQIYSIEGKKKKRKLEQVLIKI